MINDFSKYKNLTEDAYNSIAGESWPTFNDFKQNKNIEPFIFNELDAMLWNVKPFASDAFCVLPFYMGRCCTAFDSHPGINLDWDNIKQQMLKHQRPTECNGCWKLEDVGVESERLIANKTLDYYLDRDLALIFNDCVEQKNSIVMYLETTDNICNAVCVTCGSRSSTSWAQLERKNNVIPIKVPIVSEDQWDKKIDYKNAVSITLAGGETLASKNTFYILRKLTENNNTDCLVSLVTNGSVDIEHIYQDKLSQFKNLDIQFSIDGIGPIFEYMRYPIKWDSILKNIKFCKDNNIMHTVCYTISNTNVYYYNQTNAWFKENNLTVFYKQVISPFYFSPAALPKHIKEKILEKNPSGLVRTYLDLDRTPIVNDQNYQLFLAEIKKQDAWKGINIQDFLPEFAKIL